jgi:uncharacterized protein (DUF885 family)
MKYFARIFLLILAPAVLQAQQPADPLEKLASDFWTWRAKYAPFTGDDVNRIERPGGKRDWSRAQIDNERRDLGQFETRWKQINASSWPIARQVDYRLIGSAVARVRWELDINPRWKRDPTFYIEQTLTPIVEALTVPGPYNDAQSREILIRIDNVSPILEQAAQNLDKPPAPFARVAANALESIRPHLHQMASALVKSTTLKEGDLYPAIDRAADALEKYEVLLRDKLPSLPNEIALGRDAYQFFTKNVALLPYSPEQLLAMGRQELDRTVAFEVYERNRNRGLPELKLASNMDIWIKDAAQKEIAVRKFLDDHEILTVPNWLQRYTLRPMPEYLRALQGFGETDDFTSPSRLNDNGIRYVTEPSPDLGYFWRATAMDPRPICVHEGVPGHYFQLCLSWKEANSIRRHYYASTANEGIGFYAEEMMLQAGLFDDSPRTREIIYNFMRLRALRVEVDVKLALGQFTLDDAAKYLHDRVPMDSETAHEEATAFATSPGGAISYQIGKLQILKLLADGRLQQGDHFNLRAFHDFVWKNGNVPISLQRWEYLNDPSELPK